MASTREKWQEIANRGLQDRFDPQTRVKFDEAVRRGLITIPQASVQPTETEQPQQASLGDKAIGALENIGSFVSGAVAEPLAGLAGIAAEIVPGGKTGAEQVASTREALTYQPRTQEAQRQGQAIGELLQPVAEAISGTEKFLGENTLRATGSPALASIAHTLPTAALELLGVKGAAKATKVGAPSNKLIQKTLVEAAPEIEQVKKASRAIFNEVDNSGAVLKKQSLSRLDKALTELAQKEGIREGVSAPVYNAINAIKKDINRGAPVPINEVLDLRKIAQNATTPTDANVTRQALMALDEVDSFIDNLSSADLAVKGSVNAGDISKRLNSARKLWGRAKRAEMLQEAIRIGSGRKAGVEKGIRNELNNLINRKNSKKFLSKEDVAAIKKVTDGDFKQNFASLVGGMGVKFENSPSIFNAMIAGGGAGGLAASLGMSGAALPVAIGAATIGTVSKEVAKGITKNRAGFLKKMQLAGNDAERITKAYLSAVPKNKRRISDLSDLLLDPNIDLNALENISNEMVKDAVKAAQFKRELAMATTALGAGGALSEQETDNNEP